jgi:branched-chain amino acid transport system permease protein
VAALVAAFFGALLGLFSFMKNIWLGLTTLLFASVAVFAFRAADSITGGPAGMMITGSNRTLVFYLVGFFLAVSVALTEYLKRTSLGRKMIAIREGEPVPVRNTYTIKITAFALSGLLAGVAGGLFAADLRFINPATFEMYEGVLGIITLTLGGLGTTIGPLIATVGMKVFPELLRPYPAIRFTPIIYCFILSIFVYWYIYRIHPKKRMQNLAE